MRHKEKILSVIIASCIVATSFTVLLVVEPYFSPQVSNFSPYSNLRNGTVVSMSDIGNYSSMSSSYWSSISMVVYTSNLHENDISQEIKFLENKKVMVIYEVPAQIPSLHLIVAAAIGFQGVFISGSPLNYSITDLNNLITSIYDMHGFLIVNSSLRNYISDPARVNMYYLYENNYSSWINYIKSPEYNSSAARNLWVNINMGINSSMLVDGASLTFAAAGVNESSIGFGKAWAIKALNMEKSYISQNPDPIPGTGWYIPTEFSGGIGILGGTIYAASVHYFSSGINRSFMINLYGINITYGYIYSVASGLYFPHLNDTLLYEQNFMVSEGKIYINALYDSTNYNKFISKTLQISISYGNIINTSMIEYNLTYSIFYPPSIFGQYFVVNNVNFLNHHHNITYINSTIVNLFNDSIYNTTLGNFTGPFYNERYSATLSDGDLIKITAQNYTTPAYKFHAIFDILEKSFLPSKIVNTSFHSISISENSVFYLVLNSTGNYNIMKYDMITGNYTFVASTNISGGFNFYYVNGSFVIYNGGNAIFLSSSGQKLWQISLPEVMPLYFGYVLDPILAGNSIIFFSVIDRESMSYGYFYSQEVLVVDMNDGNIISQYYNNHTYAYLTCGPNELGPDFYYPVAYVDGILILTNDFGPSYMLGVKI